MCKVICIMLYLPLIIVIGIKAIFKVILIRRKCGNVTFISAETRHLLNLKEYLITNYKGYNILHFKDCSFVLDGIVLTDTNKNIFVGCDVDDWSAELWEYVMLHEIGHHESVDGCSNRKLWWNIEDHLREGIYATFTIGEIAADRWAFENGADPKVAIKFLLSELWISPVTNTLRILHAWRYMKNK